MFVRDRGSCLEVESHYWEDMALLETSPKYGYTVSVYILYL